MLTPLRTHRFGLLLARTAVVLGVLVLVCVPALTRVGQRLETASHAPSFRNVDGPPKKVTMASVVAVVLPIQLIGFESIQLAPLAPSPDTTRPRSPHLSAPRPLRAPPSAPLA